MIRLVVMGRVRPLYPEQAEWLGRLGTLDVPLLDLWPRPMVFGSRIEMSHRIDITRLTVRQWEITLECAAKFFGGSALAIGAHFTRLGCIPLRGDCCDSYLDVWIDGKPVPERRRETYGELLAALV